MKKFQKPRFPGSPVPWFPSRKIHTRNLLTSNFFRRLLSPFCSLSLFVNLKFSLLKLNMQAAPVPKKITVGPIMRRVKPKISVSRNGQVHTYTSSEAATLAWLREQGLEISLNTLRAALNPHIPQPNRVKRISNVEATIDMGSGTHYTVKRLAGTHRDRHPHRSSRSRGRG